MLYIRNIFSCLLLFALFSYSFSKDDQILFVTNFYKSYIDTYLVNYHNIALKNNNRLTADQVPKIETFLSHHPFFSKSLRRLLDSNHIICARYANGDMCGFSTDGDMFLNSQEWSDSLSFEAAQFKSIIISPNIVELSFNIWPGFNWANYVSQCNSDTNYYHRKIRFVVIKENEMWRVDDINYPDPDYGEFKIEGTMRFSIQKEDSYYINQAPRADSSYRKKLEKIMPK